MVVLVYIIYFTNLTKKAIPFKVMTYIFVILDMAYHWTVFVLYFKRGDYPPLILLFIRHILYNKFVTIKDVSYEFSL